MRVIIQDKDYEVKVKYTAFMLFYEVEIVADNNERMGKINFKIGKKENSNETWIYNISTEQKYQHIGVGKTLLKICEYMTSRKGIKVIRGRFLPSNEYAKPLYEKNGYEITKYKDEAFFCKKISIKKTQESVSKILLDDTVLNNIL